MASLFTSLIVVLVVEARFSSASAEARKSREKYIEFHFTVFNSLLPPNATAFVVVPPLVDSPGLNRTNNFGAIVVFDDPVTYSPHSDSVAIGRSKGLYVFDSKDDNAPGLENIFTIIFNSASGFPDGSTLSYRGIVSFNAPVNEVAIVGGTGLFRLARGWAVVCTDASRSTLHVKNFVYYGGY